MPDREEMGIYARVRGKVNEELERQCQNWLECGYAIDELVCLVREGGPKIDIAGSQMTATFYEFIIPRTWLTSPTLRETIDKEWTW